MTAKLLVLSLVLVLTGCAPARPPNQADGRPSRESSTPKRMVAVVRGDPPTLNHHVNRASQTFSVPGGPELQMLVSAGLGVEDDRGVIRPQLAETIPSIDNGLWQLFPDGRMVTTWKIKPEASWHDRTPFTSEDLVFTARMVQDKDLAVFRSVAYDSIESVEAPDPRTVTVVWKRPYIDADTLFTPELALPLPRHLLEREYVDNKENVLFHSYWSEDFVGTGPYRLKEFVRSSHLVLEANERFVLGRPSIDEIEVKFIPDANTLIANVLAGSVELTLGRNISLEEAVQLRDQWRDGRVAVTSALWVTMFPQFVNPSPPIVGNVQFRRALLHAIDRQALVDSFQAGLTSVADAFLSPDEPEHRDIEGSIARYAYEPAKAAAMLEALGYTRGADGAFRDGASQRLTVETRVTGNTEVSRKAMLAVADYWQRLGVGVETVVIPGQRTQDREYMATFPGFMFYRQSSQLTFLANRHSSQAPLPETNFVGQNYSRYMDSTFDGLIDRFYRTIPRPERMNVLSQIVHQMTDQLLLMGLFYDGTPTLIGKRLENVTPKQEGWNAHEWSVRH